MVMARPPGIRMERVTDVPPPLGLVDTAIPCFLGLCARGPIHEPVRIHSLAEFHDHFGRLDVGSYLARAIDGFFLNGGRACWVVRVVHTAEATKAALRLRDAHQLNTLLVTATSPGTWGQQVRVSVQPTAQTVQTFLTLDAHPGDTAVTVKSTHGLARGTLVRLWDDAGEDFRLLTQVEGRSVHWADDQPLHRGFRSAAPTMLEPAGFDLTVQTWGAREVFRGVNLSRASTQFVERVVNGVSRWVTVTALDAPTPLPAVFPVPGTDLPLTGGGDGLFTVAPDDFVGTDDGPGQRTGLAAIADHPEVDLLILPDLPWCAAHAQTFRGHKGMELVQHAVVAHCESRRDRVALLDVPADLAPSGVQQWRRLFDSSFAAFHFPWVVPASGGGAMPPSGFVAGVVARCDAAHGVYRAPANEPLHGVVDLALILESADLATLNDAGVNALQTFGQRGIRVWGARTATLDPLYRYINVRRLVSTLARTLHTGLQWVVFEPNTPALWANIARDIRVLLEGLWREGWFRGATVDDAFFVVCDARNNPPESQREGHIVVDIGLAPLRPAEFVTVRLTQQVDALTPEAGSSQKP